MCLSLYFFPFLSFYLCLLILSTLTRKFITYRGILLQFVFFLSFWLGFLVYLTNEVFFYSSVTFFNFVIGSNNWLLLDISISLKLDFLSFFFILLVVVIGLATNIYVSNYLKYEAHEDLFTLLINWFIFSMIILVLSNNLFTLFLGWESIGLSSFFLINFWSTRRGTVKSSFKAFFFNKISDVFLFSFLVILNFITCLNDISSINNLISFGVSTQNNVYLTSMCLLFMCTLFKSAQLFGHLWLPDSMEAPVPASALIHSATLVSAGVYLLLRFTPLIVLTNFQNIVLFIGSVTAAYGGLVSSSQTDMKKLLAYSTISHCGFLFVTIGTEVYLASLIYLFLHGLFKAATFFCAGSFIRVAGSQDTRNMGSLNRILPVDTAFLIICCFNLAGLPFSFGYLYKGCLLSSLLTSSSNIVVVGFCIIGLLSSIVYSYRLVYYSAFDVSKEFFPSIVYELQQKQINVVNYWSLTSIVQIIAVSIIFFFSIWIYIYFTTYFLNSDLILDHFPITFESNSYIFFNSNSFYKNYYELFYSLYLIVFMVISLVTHRVEYTFIFKLNFLLFTFITSIFFTIYTTLLS
jgi:NADH-quinone oxidoreductase subunit L